MNKEANSFKFPDVWNDDTRMNVLFSPFRPKSLDNVAWNSKFQFWSDLITSYLIYNCTPIFSISALKAAFQRNGKAPVCLDAVVEELKRIKSITVPSEIDLVSSETTLMGRLVKYLVISPLGWTINKAKAPFVVNIDPETVDYVHIPVAKKLSSDFYSKLKAEEKGKLHNLKQLCEKMTVNEKIMKIIIKYLIDERKAAAICICSDIAVKFAQEEGQAKISEIDTGIFQLEKNEKLLAENLNKLESEKENSLTKVKECLKADRKQSAKIWLRRKKEIEKYIEKRANALENIRCLLDKLKNVESDSLILQSYKLGIAALKDSMAENGLTADKAESTMDELQEVLDVSKEVEETLSRPLDDTLDGDLDAELNQLLAQDEDDVSAGPNNASFDVNNFPSVPEDFNETNKLEDRLQALSL